MWKDGLSPEQELAASYVGAHARLLAGPGTGKTYVLTRRICYLIEAGHAEPTQILVIAFTRAASHELRQRIAEQLGDRPQPRVSTLHSFALRQLMRNARVMEDLPSPLRIADDWEQRYIVLEDIKADLGSPKIDDARELFSRLEADWESLEADVPGWQPNPKFVSAFADHKRSFQYMLRAELVYRLKRALEQMPQFSLEHDFRFLLVDEYQDLNKCDLAVITTLARNRMQVYAAGDDDQSIYGFRKAHPDGIRHFPDEFAPSADLVLHVCHRCARGILQIADFVAEQDRQRIKKDLRPEEQASEGTVRLTVHDNQEVEAEHIAAECTELVRSGIEPGKILVLLRGDRRGIFSSPIVAALRNLGLPVASSTESSPLDDSVGRQMISMLRIATNASDSLAWRALLMLRANQVGEVCLSAVRNLARSAGISFTDAITAACEDPSPVPRHAKILRRERQFILELVAKLTQSPDRTITEMIRVATEAIGGENADQVAEYLQGVADEAGADDLPSLLRAVETSRDDMEQVVDKRAINILTMHKAKGLTAEAVFIAAAEDEYMPGRAVTEAEIGDERRLLYVSMTRARRYLGMTYCARRYGQQQRTGRNIHTANRTLTRFLRDAPVRPGL